jgi:hypothetical protein
LLLFLTLLDNIAGSFIQRSHAGSFRTLTLRTHKKTDTEEHGGPQKLNIQQESSLFDIRAQWEKTTSEFDPVDFWKQIVRNDETINDSVVNRETNEEGRITEFWDALKHNTDSSHLEDAFGNVDFHGIGQNLMGLISGGFHSDVTVNDIIERVRDSTNQDDKEDSKRFDIIIEMIQNYKGLITEVMAKYVLDTVDFSRFRPASLFYYIEKEDSIKTPSWKRRQHRFCPEVDLNMVKNLNNDLALARLSYADSCDEIREGLRLFKMPYELVYAEVESEPGKPGHFIALKRNQPFRGGELEAILVVRGTKTVADVVTDLCCDIVEYNEGKAHSFMLASGQYIAEKHTQLFADLLAKSGKSKLKLTLVGHSLGAGAAAIAGMELNAHPDINVEGVGFGCPSLVTQELAEYTSWYVTVVNDSDVVPRANPVTVANVLLNITEYDWVPSAKRDALQVLNELHRRQPFIFQEGVIEKLQEMLQPLIESADSGPRSKLCSDGERIQPILVPPGKCIHFYHDGYRISGRYVPNSFFCEIDVTRRMFKDHFFDSGYEQVFLDLMRQEKGDPHFRFKVEQTEY